MTIRISASCKFHNLAELPWEEGETDETDVSAGRANAANEIKKRNPKSIDVNRLCINERIVFQGIAVLPNQEELLNAWAYCVVVLSPVAGTTV